MCGGRPSRPGKAPAPGHAGREGVMGRVAGGIGTTIRLMRARRGLTQRRLAVQAGLSVPYLSLIERGERTPTLATLEGIADALGLPLVILVFLSDPEELEGIDREAAECLSLLAWKLLGTDGHRPPAGA